MDPFLGEIRTIAFTFAPSGWALCNGQSMSISQNNALFALLGTQFGGDGTTTFNLPTLPEHAAAATHAAAAAPAQPLLYIIATQGIFPSRP